MIRPREVGLLRLVALGLLGAAPVVEATEAVRRLLAVQAQDLPGAVTSVALRTGSRDRSAVLAALDAGTVVRSWPMRGTLHLLAAHDLPWLLPLAGPRMVARSAPRHRELGLDERTLQHATGVALTALADRARLTRGELTAAWEPAGIATADQRGYHLVVHLAQTGRICLGPTAPDRPATIADLARWSSLPVTEVRRGVAAVRGRLTTVAVDGVEHLMDPGTPDRLAACRDEAAQVMLLPGFDEYLLGYADRDAVLAPEHAQRLVPGRNGVFRPTVVVGGQVVATCKHVPGRRGAPATLAMECFDELDGPPAAGVERAYARLP